MSEQGTASSDGARSDGAQDVELWEPLQAVRRLEPADVALTRGFLRCRPERWLPGFGAHWLPMMHAIGCEARLLEVKPMSSRAVAGEEVFVGSVDGEPFLLALDSESLHLLCEDFVPGARLAGSSLVIEYLARRFIASLALSWSGTEASSFRFERGADPHNVTVRASVKILFSINGSNCTVWLGLGDRVVEKLDGLWRRQVHSSARVPPGTSDVRFEVAQLGVPPQLLSDYLTRGTVIDLEVPVSDAVTLKVGGKAWMPARLINVGDKLGCEMVAGNAGSATVLEGATRLSIELLSARLEAHHLAEIGQIGAVWVTDQPLSNEVTLTINQEKVGTARLCVYQGRFAVEIQ